MQPGLKNRTILLSLMIGSLCMACDRWGNEATKVKIIFTETDPKRRLLDVDIEDGGDKVYLHYLEVGEANIHLLPDPLSERQLRLLYRLDSNPISPDPAILYYPREDGGLDSEVFPGVNYLGDRRSWRGPTFEKGTGYRIEIKINGRGEITERHCILPCNLD